MSIAVERSELKPASRWAVYSPSFGKWCEEAAMRSAGRMSVGMRRLWGSRNRGRLGLLSYHRIASHVPGLPPPLHNVTPARFREQIAGLLRRGWNFIPLSEALDAAERGETLAPQTAVITFDDGFESVYESAWPLLKERRLPFTVFLCTAYIDSDEPMPVDTWGNLYGHRAPASSYRPLTTRQCQEMNDSGLCELGAHTHTHEDFRGRPEELRQDLAHCLEVLRTRFGHVPATFAFPYGSPRMGFNAADLAAAAAEAGACCGLSTQSSLVEPGADPFTWGRFNVFSWDDSATLDAKLHGWYSWTGDLRRLLRLGYSEATTAKDERTS